MRRFLVARYDVAGLSEAEVEDLVGEAHMIAEGVADLAMQRPGHPPVEVVGVEVLDEAGEEALVADDRYKLRVVLELDGREVVAEEAWLQDLWALPVELGMPDGSLGATAQRFMGAVMGVSAAALDEVAKEAS